MTRRRRSMLAFWLLASCFPLTFTAIASETLTYTYDARGRLVQVSRTGSVNEGVTASYGYDRADNRTNVTVIQSSVIILYAGQSMWSSDGRFQLVMQTDGNLVLYGPAGSMWATGTNGGSDRRMVMQTDGNLVVYNSADQALWHTSTGGNPGARLSLQNDGNLVIYNTANAAIWATNTVYQAPSFAVNDVAVSEGGALAFTVTRSGPTTGSYTINYATSDGTAAVGSDYSAASGTLTFAAGEITKTITVATIDDTTVESAETINLTLSGASGGSTISDASGLGTINDNDTAPPPPPPGFSIGDAYGIEGDILIFTVTRAGTTSGSFSVSYATANGTATSTSDYVATSGTLTFAEGEASKTISVTTIDDATLEAFEGFTVNLSGASGGATFTDAQGIGTIEDNDDNGSVCYDEGGQLVVCP